MEDKEIVFLVGSVIKPIPGEFAMQFGNTQNRSAQTPSERAQQTILSLNSIFCKYPNAKVFLLEGSLDLSLTELKELCEPSCNSNSSYFSRHNIEIIQISEVDNDVCKKINTHQNKSYCEALLFNTFLERFEDKIKDYDYIVKLSGRYSLTPNCNINTLSGTNKIYFKNYNFYDYVDRIVCHESICLPEQNQCTLYWTPCFMFIFGNEKIDDLKLFFKFLVSVTEETKVSTEDTIQYWLKTQNIINEPLSWAALAYTGTYGAFWYY